jgi:hypothetical protein
MATTTETTPREPVNVAQFVADWVRDQRQAQQDGERQSLAHDMAQAFIDQQNARKAKGGAK